MHKQTVTMEIVPDAPHSDVVAVKTQATPSSEDVDQYAALCLRPCQGSSSGLEVLLITGRDTGRWVIPKGWPMRDKKPHQVARREAWEEAGVRGRVQKSPFGYYRHLKSGPNDGPLPCSVQVHLLSVSHFDLDFPESGQRELCWFSPTEAAAVVKDPELSGLLLALEDRVASRCRPADLG